MNGLWHGDPVTPLAIAHRAGNDFEALRQAVALGADVLEADVHVRGSRLELRHSKHLRPLPLLWDHGREGGIELTRTSVPQLELDAMLGALDGSTRLMLDLKGPGRVGERVAQVVHARRPEVPVLVCSRWWPGVDAFAGHDWALPVLTARHRGELARLLRRVRTRPPYGVSLHGSLLTPAVVAQMRDSVELVMTWAVNDLDRLGVVVDLGINGVISDSADVLAEVLAQR